LHVGSNVTLLTNTTVGAMNTADFKVVGVFRSFSRDYDNRAIRISLDAAQELLDSGTPNALVVMLKETSQTTQATTKIEGAMRGRDVEVLSLMELSDFYKKTIELYRRQFGILELITMIMVVLSVISSAN